MTSAVIPSPRRSPPPPPLGPSLAEVSAPEERKEIVVWVSSGEKRMNLMLR